MSNQVYLLVLSLGVSLVFATGIPAAEPDGGHIATDPLYPQEVERWKNAEDELTNGVVKAEQLRARLLQPTATRHSGSEAVAEFVRDFQRAAQPTDGQPELLRHTAHAFDVSGDRLHSQIRGDEKLPTHVFDAFDGRWFGRWNKMNVNHDWRPSIHFTPPKVIAKNQPPIVSLQYAWISDGFGWNYLSSRESDPNKNYVLGMVYYFTPPNYRDITGEKPHVGFADSPTRLVWITEFELYLEESFPESVTGQPDHYVITGLRHDLFGDTPSVSPEAVQATYTRDPASRPSFQKITWKPELSDVAIKTK